VVHGAAIHGIHLHDHSAQDFYELNATGTFNTWEAAAEAGVRGLIFSSTMGVYGDSRRSPKDDAVVALAEGTPLRPADPYALSKVVGEEMCRYYGRRHGIPSIALRYGMFVPEPFFRYGIRLLYGGVDTADVAGSVMAAVRALAEGSDRWEAFNVESPVPFTVDDGAELRRDPLAVVDRYWPGAGALLQDRGVESLQPITEFYPMQAIDRQLGFRPRCDFGTWVEDLRTRPEVRSETPVPWP
jgi:nucleoside-diphosphate-sugar epimerase